MAKRVKLNQAFSDPDQDDTAEEQNPAPAKKATPTKKAASKQASKSGTAAKKTTTGKKTTTSRQTAKKTAAPETPTWATDEVIVRATDTRTAKPFNVALHPDDLQALDMAKVQTGYGDRQARIRSMIALWRGDPEYREAVEEHAKDAPRSGA